MTDVMPEQTTDAEQETGGWGEDSAVHYPEMPSNPHNHRFTISIDGRGPMLVVRGNTVNEVAAAFEELEDAGAGAAIGRAWAAVKAGAALGNGLGATPVAGAPGAPQAPQMPTPPPFGPNVSVPQAPGFQGNPGFQMPPAPPQSNTPEYQQSGWYRLNVPFKQKTQFDGIVAQYQLRKGRPTEGGQLSFNKADKSWYVSPEVAGAFGQFSPVPA